MLSFKTPLLLFTFLLAVFLPVSHSVAQSSKRCILKGQLHNRSDATLTISKGTEKLFNSSGTLIPVGADSTFEYILEYEDMEEYSLIFKEDLQSGSLRPLNFFPDADTIFFELFSKQNSDNDKVFGSALADRKFDYLEELNDEFGEELTIYFNKRYEEREKMAFYQSKLDSLETVRSMKILKDISADPNPYTYRIFIDDLRRFEEKNIPLSKYKEVADILAQKFPDHTYTKLTNTIFTGLEASTVGGRFVDFTAPDETGQSINFSSVVARNKYTLLDLWSTWCGPCIRKSKNLLPHYESFKEKGLEVLGVVAAVESFDDYLEVLDKYDYPWKVLLAGNKQIQIWESYGIAFSAGGQYLIDQTGTVVAVDPKPEDIAAILNKR